MEIKKVTAFLLLVFVLINNSAAQFIGAELKVVSVDSSYYRLDLTQVLKDTLNVSDTAFVSAFEFDAGMPRTDFVLKKSSGFEKVKDNGNTCGQTSNQFYRVRYSSRIDLPEVTNGYNVVWQNKSPQIASSLNTKLNHESTISLVLHFDPLVTLLKNKEVTFQYDSFYQLCKGNSIKADWNRRDGEGDSLVIKLEKIYNTSPETQMADELMNGFPIVSNYPVSPPTYEEIEYKDGFLENGFGKNLVFDEKAPNTVSFKFEEIGNYLISEKLLEYRDDVIIAESQRIFIIQIIE